MKILRKIGRITTASVMSLGLVVGLSGYAGAMTGTINTTGPDSYNKVKSTSRKAVDIKNNNNLNFTNNNNQRASSGSAKVIHNTTGGSATSGAAKNSNSLSVAASVNNAASSSALAGVAGGDNGNNSGSIANTGPDSRNVVQIKSVTKMDVQNTNNLNVANNNTQCAKSGDAMVIDNTTGGSATSGEASNTNNTSVTMNVSN